MVPIIIDITLLGGYLTQFSRFLGYLTLFLNCRNRGGGGGRRGRENKGHGHSWLVACLVNFPKIQFQC